MWIVNDSPNEKVGVKEEHFSSNTVCVTSNLEIQDLTNRRIFETQQDITHKKCIAKLLSLFHTKVVSHIFICCCHWALHVATG